jgi:auxin-responsive protein IAA
MSPPLEPHDYIGLSAAAAAPPTPTSSSSSSSSPAPRLTLRLGLPGSESPDRDLDRCEDVAAALSLGPLPATPKAPAAVSAKRAFPDPAQRPGAAKASDDNQASPAAPPAAK